MKLPKNSRRVHDSFDSYVESPILDVGCFSIQLRFLDGEATVRRERDAKNLIADFFREKCRDACVSWLEFSPREGCGLSDRKGKERKRGIHFERMTSGERGRNVEVRRGYREG